MSLTDDVQNLLRSRRVPDLPAHFVLPHYSGYSIANIAPTLAQLMGTALEGAAPTLPEHFWTHLADDVNCVVLLILDAVGYHQLRGHLDSEISSSFNRLSQGGRLIPITSVFPSTTVSALTSIWTGQPPLGHGFLGTKLLLPQQGVLANMLKMAPAVYSRGGNLEKWGWDPSEFVRAPSLAGTLAAAGIETVTHTRLSFLGSSLTQIFLRGMQELRGYVGISDLWINLRKTLVERDPGQRLFVGVYWAGADNTGHVYGPEDEYLPAALRQVDRSMDEDFLQSLPAEARKGTLLIVTADHGQIATPPEQVVRLPDHPKLWDSLLLPPAGESRAAYLYVRPGHENHLSAYTAEHLGDRFTLLDTERALSLGLWGPSQDIRPTMRVRLGDQLLVARDGSRLTTKKQNGHVALRGHHGSLTSEEMLVPLLMVRLDSL